MGDFPITKPNPNIASNQMPPEFQNQMMQMRQQLNPGKMEQQSKDQSLPPNSVDRYPKNVPYPYGMQRTYNGANAEERAVKDLENLSKSQYKGDDHYKSQQFQESNYD